MNMSRTFISDNGNDAYLSVYVQPGASADRIEGEYNAMLKVRISAPPEKGKANKALIRLLSATLGIPKSGVTVVKGETCRAKQLKLNGISAAEIEKRISV